MNITNGELNHKNGWDNFQKKTYISVFVVIKHNRRHLDSYYFSLIIMYMHNNVDNNT